MDASPTHDDALTVLRTTADQVVAAQRTGYWAGRRSLAQELLTLIKERVQQDQNHSDLLLDITEVCITTQRS